MKTERQHIVRLAKIKKMTAKEIRSSIKIDISLCAVQKILWGCPELVWAKQVKAPELKAHHKINTKNLGYTFL